MGIPDEDSYVRTGYYPSGRATGWRRIVLYVVVAIVLLGFVVGAVTALLG